MADAKKVIVMVKRQGGPEDSARWEEFSLKWHPSMNVIICLRDIAENPVTRDGKKTTPISYDSNCLEEICGSCAMLINGKARMACSALVDKLEQPIRIEPLSKFPLVRDLTVDRQFMFESPKRVKPWIPIDGTYDLGEGPPVSPEIQEQGYPLSNCISCGNCWRFAPGQRAQQIRRRGHHQPGPALQHASHGRDEQKRAACGTDGPRGHSGLRQRAELRACLPQEHSIDGIHRRRQP
jgi:succinate dehydrogenase/fumarate reductase iron-sulfur protein